jgi:glycosyltransferase involved in cell wall biosynthesis
VRILFLSQLLPLPLDAGAKIRAYYVLRHLIEAGHSVSLLCFVRPTDRTADLDALTRLCGTVETVAISRSRVKDARDGFRSVFSNEPFLIMRDRSSEMDARLQHLMMRVSFDAVHADQLWMAPYAARCSSVPFKVLDQHNAVFKVPDRLAAQQRHVLGKSLLRWEAAKLATFERTMFDNFNHVVWVSEEDRRVFPGLAGSDDGVHRTIPIAVDPAATKPIDRPRPFRVTFLGGIHWPPNAEGVSWFLDCVWPAIERVFPDCVFTVIGKDGDKRLRRGELPARTEVTGYVPDLRRYLSETAVFVVPLHTGAGMRVKILDAWSWGLPVVSTSVGAEGIHVAQGHDVLIANDAQDFAESVVRVLRDRGLAKRLAANGRETVQMLYDWRRVYPAWDGVYH